MTPYRRVSIGYTAKDDADNEWHQQIRDILDIGQTSVSQKSDLKIRRRTVCCDYDSTITSRQAKEKSGIIDRDESTASLSFSSVSRQPGCCISSCDISPASPMRPAMSSLYSGRLRDVSPSPKKAVASQMQNRFHLAKHRINSPRRHRTGSSCHESSLKSSSPKSPFAEAKSYYAPKADFSTEQEEDLPDVPFTPVSDYGSPKDSSSDDISNGDDDDSHLSKQENFRKFNSQYVNDRTIMHHKNGVRTGCSRRSSCGDPPSSPNEPVSKIPRQNRRASCNDASSGPSLSNKTTNNRVLQSPLYSTPKAAPKIAINVKKRSAWARGK